MPAEDPTTTQQKPRSRRRKTVVGTVRSDKMKKTIRVDIIRLERHPKYHKFIRRRSSFHAHDEREEARVGDLVRIAETRPLSKLKRWRLVEIVRRSARARTGEGETAEGQSGEGKSDA